MERKTLWDLRKNSERVSVMEVYQVASREAREQREYAKKLQSDDEQKTLINEGANAMYEILAALENTEEINPTRTTIDFYSERDLPAIGEIIERNGSKWKVVDNAVRNVSTLEKVN